MHSFALVELALIVWAFLLFRDRRRVQTFTSSQFPKVAPAEFDRWRQLELNSMDRFLWAVMVSVVIDVLVTISVSMAPKARMIWDIALPVVSAVAGVLFASGPGREANALKKSLDLFPATPKSS